MNIPKSKDFISFKEVTVFLKSVLGIHYLHFGFDDNCKWAMALPQLPQLVDNELPFIDLLQSGCPPKAENVLSRCLCFGYFACKRFYFKVSSYLLPRYITKT